MNIGDRIKEKRKELGMSADELGAKIGKSRATVFRYENGDIENMPIDILKPIAEALNTSPAYLMGWEDNENYQAIARMQSDTIAYEDRIINQMKEKLDDLDIDALSTLNDILTLRLSATEWNELRIYAEFICSKRK